MHEAGVLPRDFKCLIARPPAHINVPEDSIRQHLNLQSEPYSAPVKVLSSVLKKTATR